ncbi:hypothetical protein GGH15_002677 [Coemansia sp. RSA 562]|nr:hypothetical protein GGH15_002677 [Coemansia sp. RSA 562]
MAPPKSESAAVSSTNDSSKLSNTDRSRKGKQAQHIVPETTRKGKDDEVGESGGAAGETVCFICADSVSFYAVGQCDHRTCFRCSLRLRELFKSKACPYCKTDLDTIIYTRDAETEHAVLLQQSFPFEEMGIKFDCKEAHEATKHALQFNCPHRKCQYIAKGGWKDLKAHVRNEHSLQFCDLCLKNKMSFAHEHKLFTKGQLRTHYACGEGAGFTGHPSCEFCRCSFYDNDQLFDHCRKKHEQCFICVRNKNGQQVYYENYGTLEEHFNNDHFPCEHPSCLEKKFVVFESRLDLQGHDLSEHGQSIVGQRARREAKQVNVDFRYAGSGSSSAGAGRGRSAAAGHRPTTMTVNGPDATGVSIAGRRRPTGFGRVSSTPRQPTPVRATPTEGTSTPEPSSPEPEPETLWPTLGSNSAASTGSQRSTASTSSAMRDRVPSNFGRLSIADSRKTTEPYSTSALNAEATAKHQDLLQRVSAFLSHREQPVERFRQMTTRFKDGQMTAEDYIQSCWLLFLTVPGKNAKEMIQKTMRSVSELLPDAALKDVLLKALNVHRIKQQQFPALTPLIVSRKSAAAEPTARVLVIKPGTKTATPTSKKTTALKPRSEHVIPPTRNVPVVSKLSESAFPSLGGNSQAARSAAQTSSTSHNSYSAKFNRAPSSTAFKASAAPSGASEFPDMPPASAPRRKIAPLDPNATSAWENSLSTTSSTKNTKKQSRNSKGKQVLFHVG